MLLVRGKPQGTGVRRGGARESLVIRVDIVIVVLTVFRDRHTRLIRECTNYIHHN